MLEIYRMVVLNGVAWLSIRLNSRFLYIFFRISAPKNPKKACNPITVIQNYLLHDGDFVAVLFHKTFRKFQTAEYWNRFYHENRALIIVRITGHISNSGKVSGENKLKRNEGVKWSLAKTRYIIKSKNVKVNQSHYRPGEAQRVPGS